MAKRAITLYFESDYLLVSELQEVIEEAEKVGESTGRDAEIRIEQREDEILVHIEYVV